jgi:hypothetical protein
MTLTEWATQYRALRERAENVNRMVDERIRQLAQRAGLDRSIAGGYVTRFGVRFYWVDAGLNVFGGHDYGWLDARAVRR